MNRDKIEELGRRAVACKHWRWMPGMVDSGTGGRLVATTGTDDMGRSGRWAEDVTGDAWLSDWGQIDFYATPDFTDPATLGFLLNIIRDAWSDPYASCLGDESSWEVTVRCEEYELPGDPGGPRCEKVFMGQTEAEALVKALEAAP